MDAGCQFRSAMLCYSNGDCATAFERMGQVFPMVPRESRGSLFSFLLRTVGSISYSMFDVKDLFLASNSANRVVVRLEEVVHWLHNIGQFTDAYDLLNAVYALKYYDFVLAPSNRYLKRVNFELASVCNLKCKYCTFESGKRTRYLDRELFRKILVELAEFCPELPVLALYMSGESLLHPEFEQLLYIVNEVKQDHPDFAPTVYLHTNGMLWTPDLHDRILKSGALTRVVWSIDGVDKITFEDMRKGADYERTLSHFEYFLDHRGEMQAWVNNLQDESCLELPMDERLQELFARADRVMSTPPKDLNQSNLSFRKYAGKGGGLCSYLFETAVVSSDGRMSLCCVDYNVENGFGDLRETSFADLYCGPERQRIMTQLYEGKRYALPGCSSCTLQHSAWVDGEVGLATGLVPQEEVEALVVKRWKQLHASMNVKRIALFGAGQHSLWLDRLLCDQSGPEVVAVLDDCDRVGASYGGLVPLFSEGFDVSEVDAIILSSDCWQPQMEARCRALYGDDVVLVDLYEGLPPGPYKKCAWDEEKEA